MNPVAKIRGQKVIEFLCQNSGNSGKGPIVSLPEKGSLPQFFYKYFNGLCPKKNSGNGFCGKGEIATFKYMKSLINQIVAMWHPIGWETCCHYSPIRHLFNLNPDRQKRYEKKAVHG